MPTFEEALIENRRRAEQRARAEEALRISHADSRPEVQLRAVELASDGNDARAQLAQGQGTILSLRDIQTPGGGTASVLVDPTGAITAPVTNSRPLTPEEYRELDAARRTPNYEDALSRIYAPERRAQAHTYAPDAFLSRAERDRLAQRALEEDAARDPARQVRIARNRQALRNWAWANANTPLTGNQRAAHERWLRRTEDRMASGRNWNRDVIADRRYEQQRIDEIARAALDRQALTERQRLISQATVDAAQATGQSDLQKAILETQGKQYVADRNLEGTRVTADANRYAADQDLNAANIGAQADRDVAKTNADATRYAAEQRNAGQVTAAQPAAQADRDDAKTAADARVTAAQTAAQGQVNAAEAQAQGNIGAAMARSVAGGADDPAKAYLDRGSEMYRLAMSAKRNGLTPDDLVALDLTIDQDTSLSPAQKAQKKQALRNNNDAAANQFMVYADYYYRLAGLPGVALPEGVAQMPLPAPANPELPAPAPVPAPIPAPAPAPTVVDPFTKNYAAN